MSAPDAFTVKTHAELARLSTEAKAARRLIGHRACSDSAACRHCSALRATHLRIDDHLDQLEESRVEPEPAEPYAAPTPNRICGCCGRMRYSNFRGAVSCLACDGTPTGSEWISLDLEAQE